MDFFRADSIKQAIEIIYVIVSFNVGIEQPYFWLFVALCSLCIVQAVVFVKRVENNNTVTKSNFSKLNGYYPIFDLSTLKGLTLFFIFCGLTICLAYTGGSPFIYGKF